MYEQYQRNRMALAERMQVPSKILPEHVNIVSLSFFKGEEETVIECTESNTAGMLFFQEQFTAMLGLYHSRNLTHAFLRVARIHFAEFWDDAEKEGRPMILALRKADRVVVTWKNK